MSLAGTPRTLAGPPRNRADRLEAILRDFGGKATLGQLLQAMDGGLGYKFTAAVSELRKKLESSVPARTVKWTKGKTPSLGVYEIVKCCDVAYGKYKAEKEPSK